MQLSKYEVRKDQIQQTADAAITALGNLVAIGFDTARRATHEVGAFMTEVFEIREAGRRAEADGQVESDAVADALDAEEL